MKKPKPLPQVTYSFPVRDGKRLTFHSLADIGKHYALLANAYRKDAQPGTEQKGRCDAYDLVSWALQNTHMEA